MRNGELELKDGNILISDNALIKAKRGCQLTSILVIWHTLLGSLQRSKTLEEMGTSLTFVIISKRKLSLFSRPNPEPVRSTLSVEWGASGRDGILQRGLSK